MRYAKKMSEPDIEAKNVVEIRVTWLRPFYCWALKGLRREGIFEDAAVAGGDFDVHRHAQRQRNLLADF
jgi:hypothetical protein